MSEEWTVPGYTQSRELGAGASGRVVLAVHDPTGSPVAIKYLSARLRGDEEFLARFRAEAELLSELEDPNLVRFYEYVESVSSAAIVMELVDGVSLKELIRAEGPTGPEAALLVLKGALLGLSAAHAAGVVHRDFKPGNILINGDGASKLADFGIAVREGSDAPAAGTPAYMAPEQWRGLAASPSADVYAATAVFYECLTGERPYPMQSVPAVAAAHATAPVPVELVPEPLRDLVAYGMAKNPTDRPPSAEAFLFDLESAATAGYGPHWEARGRARLAALAGLLAMLFPLAEQAPGGGTALAHTRLGRRRGLVAGGVVVGGLLLVGAFALAGGTQPVASIWASTSTPTPVAITPGLPGDQTKVINATPTTPGPTPSGMTPTPGTSGPTHGPDPTPTKTGHPRPPKTRVTGLSVDSLSQPSAKNAAATITVNTSGTGPVSLMVTFSNGQSPDGSPHFRRLSGSTSYTISLSHDFENCPTSITVIAGTSPESATGPTSKTITGTCPG